MNRSTFSFCCLALTLAGFYGCSSKPAADASKQAVPMDKIHGKALILEETASIDTALNAGGPSVYILDGVRRYRLFFNTAIPVVSGKEYVAEGINAQKAIDEIGDPDQGKNGYPLPASCDRVIKMAWPGLSFDAADSDSAALRAKVKRYPARTIFLVTKLEEAPAAKASESADAKKPGADEKEPPEVNVAAEKQSALLVKGATVQKAPLWEPEGGTVKCKVLIGTDGKISDLETGNQLCESVPWGEFEYKPTEQRGHPVKVRSEVEVRFEAKK